MFGPKTHSSTWKGAAIVVVAACMAVAQPGCDKPAAPDGAAAAKAVEVTDANFKQVTATGVALIDFWAAWCPPCTKQGPIVERLAGRYAGQAVVGKLDVEKNPKATGQFAVESIPTLIVFKDGQPAQRLIGLQSEAALAAVLDEALGGN